MNYTMVDFIKEYYPEVEEEYNRYISKEKLPEVGEFIETLVGGYGSFGGGRVLKVTSYFEDYIELTDPYEEENQYLCKVKNWWKELKIIKEPIY